MVESFKSRAGMPFPRFRTPFSARSMSARCRCGMVSATASWPARAHQAEIKSTSVWGSVPSGIERARTAAKKGRRAMSLNGSDCQTAASEDAALTERAAPLPRPRTGLTITSPIPVFVVNGRREPRAKRFEALIARADQYLPVTEVWVACVSR